ncbi:hypothetical protein BpHYR1_007902 [Brachionus plicatilis]|uniref:Uncharacterized protein n=1 Tax=Brachionus plicatilis TaxID=10195 RepID=A0A3M7QJA6_BRAPC|nr:hypothetical protein BpHYR1_007902 [Brachionus plicatilis]
MSSDNPKIFFSNNLRILFLLNDMQYFAVYRKWPNMRQIERKNKFFQKQLLTCHVKQKNSLGKIKLFQFE